MGEQWNKFRNLLDSATKNLSQAFYDQYVEVNVALRSKSGLRVVIFRDELGDCCDWCKDLAGTYSYDSAPTDVFARHEYCKCIVTSKTEKGTWQDVWSRSQYDSFRNVRIARERAILAEGMDNRKKVIDKFGDPRYHNTPANVRELAKIYDRDVADGWISPISGFDNYLRLYMEVEEKVIGITTSTGVTITGQSEHFLDRVIGTAVDPKIFKEKHKKVRRSGVSVEDVVETLVYGKYRTPVLDISTGEYSQVFSGKNSVVTINPLTGNLIQCNPK